MTNREAAAACAIVVVGLAAWYALSDGSDRGLLRRPAATRAVPTSLDAGATALADEVARLQRMQSPASSPRPARDLFRFAAHAQPQPTSIAPPVVPVTVQPAAPPRPPLRLIGVAEDGAAGSPVRVAIISSPDQLYVVKEGERVTARYGVAKISPDVVELVDTGDSTALRLALK